jgi:hypothetical protein
MRTLEQTKAFWKLILDCHSRPFKWGTFDCGTFAIEVIETVSDLKVKEQVLKELGEWNSEREALRVHLGNLNKVVEKFLAGKEFNKNYLGLGDIGLAEYGSTQGLCAHDGQSFVAPSVMGVGLQRIPLGLVIKGWRI